MLAKTTSFRRLIAAMHPDEAVLVGGNAIAFWARHYGLRDDAECLTRDIDFFGSAADAIECEARIPQACSAYFPDMGDATVNTAKIAVHLPGETEPLEIDFVRSVTGLGDSEINKLALRMLFVAAPEEEGIPIRVLHPLMCLDSKITNLWRHPGKRTEEGQEQARLAIRIAHRFLEVLAAKGEVRKFINGAKRVFSLGRSDQAAYAHTQFDIDILGAIPVIEPPPGELRDFFERHFPVARNQIVAHRERFVATQERIRAYKSKKRSPGQ